jgi:YesN/AraC family two-component response regulator
MFNMIIVDDESEIANMMKTLIDWQEYNVNVSAVCTNSKDALSSIMLYKPEVVITDIRMPGMNGIDLISKVHEFQLKTKFVIVSAYAEFDYAREAMKYNVKHYLIKPCSEEQVVHAVTEVCTDIISERRRNRVLVGDKNKKKNQSFFSPQIEQVIQYIEENISDDEITLKKISETQVFSNVDYLCRKFHQETGHKFNSYLNSLRISKAKDLMFNSMQNETIYSIADKVGFRNNPQYFSQVFKRATGMSPTEYQNILQWKK